MIDYLCTQTLFENAYTEFSDTSDSLQDHADHYLHIAEKLKLCKLGLVNNIHYYIRTLNEGTTLTDLREGYLCYIFKIFNDLLLNFIDHNYFKAIYYSKSTKIVYPIVTNQSNYDHTMERFSDLNAAVRTLLTHTQDKNYDRLVIVPNFIIFNELTVDIYLVYIQLNKNKGLYLVNDSNLEDLNVNFNHDIDKVIDEFSFYKGITLHKLFEYDNQKDKITLS